MQTILDELGNVLVHRNKLGLIHQALRKLPSSHPNRDLLFSVIERQIRVADQKIAALINSVTIGAA